MTHHLLHVLQKLLPLAFAPFLHHVMLRRLWQIAEAFGCVLESHLPFELTLYEFLLRLSHFTLVDTGHRHRRDVLVKLAPLLHHLAHDLLFGLALLPGVVIDQVGMLLWSSWSEHCHPLAVLVELHHEAWLLILCLANVDVRSGGRLSEAKMQELVRERFLVVSHIDESAVLDAIL